MTDLPDPDEWLTVESVPTRKHAIEVMERREIDTREGTVVAEPGDYIVREADGHIYPISGPKFNDYYRVIE